MQTIQPHKMIKINYNPDDCVATLPVLGKVKVRRINPGEWLYLSRFGWHNCSVRENTALEAKYPSANG